MIIRSDDDLERLQADGTITPGDADEVRTFAAFLTDAVPRAGEDKPHATSRAYREHYPEQYATAVAEERARRIGADGTQE